MLDGVPALNFKPEQLATGKIPLVKEHSEHIDLGNDAWLNLIHRLALSTGVGLLQLQNTTTPQFEFDTPVDLDAALEHAFDLLDVVTNAADRVVAFEDVTFSHPGLLMRGESRRVAVGLHKQWRAQANPNRKQLVSELYEMSDAAYWLFVLNLLVEANAPADVYTHLTTTAPRFAFLRSQIRRHF